MINALKGINDNRKRTTVDVIKRVNICGVAGNNDYENLNYETFDIQLSYPYNVSFDVQKVFKKELSQRARETFFLFLFLQYFVIKLL